VKASDSKNRDKSAKLKKTGANVQLELKTRAVMQLALFIYMEKNQLDTRIQHIYLFPVKQILQTIQRFEIKKI
jgi:hypothetical protein